jgi:tol-pal system protein YbgF
VASARTALEQLVSQYPTSDLAADAQFLIAESYATEGNTVAADSGYAAVIAKYPKTPNAPRALFKHALILERSGKVAEAKAAFQKVIADYPNSDEAVLAKDHVRDE